MIAIADGPKGNWMQIPYSSNPIPNNSHLPPPPTLSTVPATSIPNDIKPYIGDEALGGGQMTHLSRQVSSNTTGHNHSGNSSSSKSAQERVKRPMNAFMVRIPHLLFNALINLFVNFGSGKMAQTKNKAKENKLQ